MRNLVRARTAAVETVRVHKQQVNAFMLRHGRTAPVKKNWGARYRRWLQEQRFEHPADQIVLQEYVEAVRLAEERLGRPAAAIAEFLPGRSLATVGAALQALAGVGPPVPRTLVVEVQPETPR